MIKIFFLTLIFISINNNPIFASPPVEQMQKNTVLIACVLNEREGNVGSGFAINQRDIVTNQHVVDCFYKGGRIIVISNEKKFYGEVIWQSRDKDLAVVRTEKNHDIPAAVIASSSSVRVTDTVYAAGFPMVTRFLNFLDRKSLSTVSISKGVVTAKVKTKENVKLLQIDAPINPGNSGGPLFNEEGHVIGINSAKALSIVAAIDPETMTLKPERIPASEGIGWSIESDELIIELKKERIKFNKADIFYSFPFSSFIKNNSFISLLIFLSILVAAGAFLLRKKLIYVKRTDMSNTPINLIVKKPLLISLGGPLKGATVEFDNKPISIGRDPTMSNLIIKDPENIVSKRHCTIRFDFFEKKFYIIDHSRNGTFLKNGIRINDKVETELKSGDRFYLSKPDFLFEVKFE